MESREEEEDRMYPYLKVDIKLDKEDFTDSHRIAKFSSLELQRDMDLYQSVIERVLNCATFINRNPIVHFVGFKKYQTNSKKENLYYYFTLIFNLQGQLEVYASRADVAIDKKDKAKFFRFTCRQVSAMGNWSFDEPDNIKDNYNLCDDREITFDGEIFYYIWFRHGDDQTRFAFFYRIDEIGGIYGRKDSYYSPPIYID